MPIYEYSCPACGSTHDSLHSYPPPDSTPCGCGAEAERRFPMPARTPARWTGNGWGSAAVRASGPSEKPANAVDTSAIADGMSTAEWRKKRKKAKAEKVRKWAIDQT